MPAEHLGPLHLPNRHHKQQRGYAKRSGQHEQLRGADSLPTAEFELGDHRPVERVTEFLAPIGHRLRRQAQARAVTRDLATDPCRESLGPTGLFHERTVAVGCVLR